MPSTQQKRCTGERSDDDVGSVLLQLPQDIDAATAALVHWDVLLEYGMDGGTCFPLLLRLFFFFPKHDHDKEVECAFLFLLPRPPPPSHVSFSAPVSTAEET